MILKNISGGLHVSNQYAANHWCHRTIFIDYWKRWMFLTGTLQYQSIIFSYAKILAKFLMGHIFSYINRECLCWLSASAMINSLVTKTRGQEVGGKGHWMEKLGGFQVIMWKICPGQ